MIKRLIIAVILAIVGMLHESNNDTLTFHSKKPSCVAVDPETQGV